VYIEVLPWTSLAPNIRTARVRVSGPTTDNGSVTDRLPTAPIAAAGLIAGYAVALGSGSRPLGGVVMAALGLLCIRIWLRRDGRRTAIVLTATGLLAFALSHMIAIATGAWPAVLLVAALTAAACWRLSDAAHLAAPAHPAGAER
jgi:hypothetical protein